LTKFCEHLLLTVIVSNILKSVF